MRVRRRIGHSEAAEELDVGGKFKVWIWPEFLCAPMPDGKDVWSSLRPHALFVTLNGAMTPVARRR